MASKVMVSFPPELLSQVDEAAQREHRSRSEFLREAARLYLRVLEERTPPGQDPQIRRAIAIQDAIARQDTIPWDGGAEIRRWRDER